MSSGWREYKLGDVAELINGFAFKSTDFSDTGVPVIKIKNVASGTLLLDDVQYYPFEITGKLNPFVLKKDDILIAMTGSHVHQISSMVGRVTRYDKPFMALLNQRVGKIVSRQPNILNEDYIYHFLKQEDVAMDLAANAGGSANQANISSEQIRNFPISLPPISEQRAIAGVLSSLDDKIDLLHWQNKTLEGMAEALWRKMFVEEADPGWEKGRLGDIARNIRENVTVEDLENHDNYVGLEHIERKHLALYEWGHAADLGSNKARFRKRDILFGKLRAYFHKVCFAPIDGVCSTDILVIRPLIPEYHALCLLWFFSEDVVNYSDASSGGTRMPRTNWETLAGYEILIPGKDHINRFSAYVKPMIDRIEMNIFSIRTLSRLRDTLLPKLMSGEVVVKA